MHDPMTVAWEIKRPWKQKSSLGGWYPPMITIWHVDPEKDNTDDSCGWFSPKLTKQELAHVKRLIRDPMDNLRSFFPDADTHDAEWRLAIIWRGFKRFHRPWWQHPRYHFWHYRIQIHFTQALKRWLFSRCCVCGKRFRWGYSPLTYSWNGVGPRWFRSEPKVLHLECDQSRPAAGREGEK